MKLIASLLSFALFLQLVCYPLPMMAAVSFSDGGAQGSASVNKIGKLLIAEGIATLTATSIEIASKDSSGNQTTQLKGRLFNTEKAGSVIKGMAFFNGGPLISDLDSVGCNDYVKKIDGSKVTGPVTDVTDSAVTCGGTSIPMGNVAQIHSARVFKYSTKVGESPKMNFSATCVKAKAQGEKLSTKRKIIIGTVAALIITGIACGIAIPIAVANSGGHHNNPVYFNPTPAPAPQQSSQSSSSSSVSSP
ncbi:MAG: hypothetical protein AB7W16_23885 [Candidatus Obscuribacterales bacterium]